jgi:hypothetical protein
MHCKETASAVQRGCWPSEPDAPGLLAVPDRRGSAEFGVRFAIQEGVDSRKGWSEKLDALIESVDGMCREAERTGTYAREALSRRPFYPDRRRNSRIPPLGEAEHDNSEAA